MSTSDIAEATGCLPFSAPWGAVRQSTSSQGAPSRGARVMLTERSEGSRSRRQIGGALVCCCRGSTPPGLSYQSVCPSTTAKALQHDTQRWRVVVRLCMRWCGASVHPQAASQPSCTMEQQQAGTLCAASARNRLFSHWPPHLPEAFRSDYGALVTRGASAEGTSGRTPGARPCQDTLGTLY
jgi:hypothetical protein